MRYGKAFSYEGQLHVLVDALITVAIFFNDVRRADMVSHYVVPGSTRIDRCIGWLPTFHSTLQQTLPRL